MSITRTLARAAVAAIPAGFMSAASIAAAGEALVIPPPAPSDRADILCLTPFGETWIMEGTPAGHIGPERTGPIDFFHDPEAGYHTVAGDWDGDGDLDLAMLDPQETLHWAYNDGTGRFVINESEAIAAVFGPDPAAGGGAPRIRSRELLVAADWDANGLDDLLFLYLPENDPGPGVIGTLFRYESGPDIRLNPSVKADVEKGERTSGPRQSFAADLNRDGREELVRIIPTGGNTLPIGRNIRNEMLAYDVTVDAFIGAPPAFHDRAVAGDFDGDGQEELAWIQNSPGPVLVGKFALQSEPLPPPPEVWMYPGYNHDAMLGGDGWAVFAGEMTGDGLDDLIQVNDIGEVWVARSMGDRFLQPVKFYATGFRHQDEGPWQVFIGKFRN